MKEEKRQVLGLIEHAHLIDIYLEQRSLQSPPLAGCTDSFFA